MVCQDYYLCIHLSSELLAISRYMCTSRDSYVKESIAVCDVVKYNISVHVCACACMYSVSAWYTYVCYTCTKL